jgi:hypothetical protein
VSGRVESDAGGASASGAGLAPAAPLVPGAVAAIDASDGWGDGPTLPHDHPAWMRDTLSVSQRARALLARIKPVAVRVVAFWEHRVRSIVIGSRTLSVDASGSYRCS